MDNSLEMSSRLFTIVGPHVIQRVDDVLAAGRRFRDKFNTLPGALRPATVSRAGAFERVPGATHNPRLDKGELPEFMEGVVGSQRLVHGPDNRLYVALDGDTFLEMLARGLNTAHQSSVGIAAQRLIEARELEPLLRVVPAVARISCADKCGREVFHGTGTLVSKRCVLTAAHVVPDNAASVFVSFGGCVGAKAQWKTAVTSVERALGLDCALLHLSEPQRVVPVTLAAEGVHSGSHGTIFQYSDGDSMMCGSGPLYHATDAITHWPVLREKETEGHLFYQIDTDKGASGGPIVNLHGMLVGVHRDVVIRAEDRPGKAELNCGVSVDAVRACLVGLSSESAR